MGKRLIIKGADFSANGIVNLPTKLLLNTSFEPNRSAGGFNGQYFCILGAISEQLRGKPIYGIKFEGVAGTESIHIGYSSTYGTATASGITDLWSADVTNPENGRTNYIKFSTPLVLPDGMYLRLKLPQNGKAIRYFTVACENVFSEGVCGIALSSTNYRLDLDFIVKDNIAMGSVVDLETNVTLANEVYY